MLGTHLMEITHTLLSFGMKCLFDGLSQDPPPLNFIIFTNFDGNIRFSPIMITKMTLLIVSLCLWYLKTWV